MHVLYIQRCAAETAAVPWPPSCMYPPPSLALAQGYDYARTTEPPTPTSPGGGGLWGGGGGGLSGGTGASGAVSGAVYCEEVLGMYAEEEVLRRSKEMQASCGSLCLEGQAIALLCSLARQRLVFPPTTPTTGFKECILLHVCILLIISISLDSDLSSLPFANSRF